MTKVYAIVSLETPFHQQYYIWGVVSSRENAKIACKTVKANIRAHGMLQLLDFELDELCPAEGLIWRVVMGTGPASQATLVKRGEDQFSIVQLPNGGYIAFVDTEFKEDAISQANVRRLQYSQGLVVSTEVYNTAMDESAKIKQRAHGECDVPTE